ncbi:MAG TPA: GNAT family N-acetyltransferase [Bacteroidetes bacterium]|nr:GNAT family N-acetyltransferase [Bacteroidota bacterium]
MKTPIIRLAQHRDLPAIASFNQKMARETEDKELPDSLILPGVEAVLNDPLKGFYLVAETDNVLIGQLMITYEWSDWRNANIWWIQSVYVEKAYRGQGIYTALYEKIKEEARVNGVQTIRLYVEKENAVAQSVYEKLGMEETVYKLYEVTLQ